MALFVCMITWSLVFHLGLGVVADCLLHQGGLASDAEQELKVAEILNFWIKILIYISMSRDSSGCTYPNIFLQVRV